MGRIAERVTVDPIALPRCDICGADAMRYLLQSSSDGTLSRRISFCCGANIAQEVRRGQPKPDEDLFPNGDLTSRGEWPGEWARVDRCGNAQEVVVRERSGRLVRPGRRPQ